MTWPPKVGEPLPNAEDAYNVYEKLGTYALDQAHGVGGNKARVFLEVLGITAEDIDYLASAVLTGVLENPVREIRPNPPWGINCNVTVPVRGLRGRAGRIADVRTAWELRYEGDWPRLVTAFID